MEPAVHNESNQQVARAVLFRFSHSARNNVSLVGKIFPQYKFRLCMRARDFIDKSECEGKCMIREGNIDSFF